MLGSRLSLGVTGMRRVVVSGAILAVLAGVPACGDDGVTTTSVAAPVVTFDVSACPEPVTVSDAEGFLAVLAEVPWDAVGPYSSGSEPPSADVVVAGTLTITGDEVPLPASCLERDDCRHTAVFESSQPGTTVEGGENWFEGVSTLTVSDATVRLSPSLMDTHPGPYNFVPVLSLTAPCGTPCTPDGFACQADLSCYWSFDSYCRRCEGRSAEECACRTEIGIVEDGEPCDYFESGDVINSGVCLAGRCENP